MKLRKMKMLLVTVLGIAALASCSSGEKVSSNLSDSGTSSSQSSQQASTSSSVAEHTIKYQFAGENTEYASFGFAYTYYLNLYSDGLLDGYGYRFYSLDTTTASENQNYAQWFTGKWAKAKDDDDTDCYRLVVNYVDGLKSMAGQAISGKYNYIVYDKTGGGLTNINNFNVPLGMSGRTVTLEYKTGDFYTSGDDFIEKTVYKFEAPTTFEALFEDTGNHDRIYLFDDNTGKYFGASTNKANNQLGYYPKSDVKWSYKNGKLVLEIDQEREVTVEGKKGTLSWEETLQGDYKTKHNFVCEDVSKLTSKESGGSSDISASYPQNSVYFTYTMNLAGYKISLNFYSTEVFTKVGVNEYVNQESTDELLSFVNADANSNGTFVLKKNGTFDCSVTLGGNPIKKTGTFTWKNYSFTFHTTDGSVDDVKSSVKH